MAVYLLVKGHQNHFTLSLKIKTYIFLFVIISGCVIEAKIKTPPLLAENKLAAYLDESGIGLPFLHFAVVLLPVVTAYVLMNHKFAKLSKIILIAPPLLFLMLWMQRGLIIWFVFMILAILSRSFPLKKQILIVVVVSCFSIFFINYIGTSRSSGTDYKEDFVNTISDMKVNLPPALVWLYIYPTTSLNNFNQVVDNSIDYVFAYGLIEPIVSVLQLKKLAISAFDIEKKENTDFEVFSGFNVPTVFYWFYKNLGYFGMCLFPFILGAISQYFFNAYSSSHTIGIVLYSIWYPNILYSFHDFLFWNSPMLLSMVLAILLCCKVRFGSTNFQFSFGLPRLRFRFFSKRSLTR